MVHTVKLNLPHKVRIWLVYILVPLVTTTITLAATLLAMFHVINYEYTANSMVYIARNRHVSQQAMQESLYQELLADKELARDFSNFIASEGGLAQLQENLGEEIPWLLQHRYNADDHFIEAVNDTQSRVINILVSCDNPYDAAIIANECTNIIREFCKLVYVEDYVQTVKTAEPLFYATYPERKVVLPIGVGAGFAIGVLIDLLIWRRDKRKQNARHEFRQLRPAYRRAEEVSVPPVSAPAPQPPQPSPPQFPPPSGTPGE